MGPRAAQALIVGAKARAMLYGHFDVRFEDVHAIVHPVMRHRIIPNFHAEAEGVSSDDVINMLLDYLPYPGMEVKKEEKPSFFSRLFKALLGRRGNGRAIQRKYLR